MYAIASEAGREGRWAADDFLQSGESTVAGMMATLDSLGARPAPGRALDFGCGLGRLSRALSFRFDEVWGVDISATMVEGAATLNADRAGCRFRVNTSPTLPDVPSDAFDLVLSLITLQHVSRKVEIRSYIGEFIRVTRPGGVVVFQLPSSVARRARFHPRRLPSLMSDSLGLRNSLVRSSSRGSYTLNSLPETEVRELLLSHSASILAVIDDNRVGSDAVPSRMYVAQVPPAQ